MSRYWQPTYTRRDGTVVRGHWVRGSNGGTNTQIPPPSRSYASPSSPPPSYPPAPPVSNRAAPRHRKKKRKAIAITATAVVTVGAVTFTLTRGDGSAGASDSFSVQANVDFTQVMTELPKLGFAGSIPQDAASDSSPNCSQASTGDVQQFLMKNPCKEYAVTLVKLHNQQVATQAVVTWVVMPTSGLTLQYKVLIDLRYKGNPPGQSTDFDGLCYASGVDGDSAWAAQVQPTGQVSVDRQILKSVVPVKLSTSYLEGHCVG